LTDEEAELLRNDDRVFCVEIPPEHRDDIIIGRNAIQISDFTKTTSDSGAYVNWGLKRVISELNNYGTGIQPTQNPNEYPYTLTGKGVDVVIQDSGIQVDHPEFQDEFGNSRVQQINWSTESGISFTQNANHYRDFDGHGTHVAGIAAGKTFGWAKNSRIYAVKLAGLEGSGDGGTGISTTYAFDCIKGWHNNKPKDSTTGFKRPTVVNMSWGYLDTYTSVTSINYRGVNYTSNISTAAARQTNYGLMNIYYPAFSSYVTNVRVSSVDTDIEEMVDAGIVVCIAAGNRSHKIDVVGGVDYNNYAVTDGGTLYYHRGSSPNGAKAIIVGNIDSSIKAPASEQKAASSECGPGVDIYAPGTDIMSATSNTNSWGAGSQNYYLNSSYKQTNISGTSMASPQVCGVAALLLEINPSTSPQQIKHSLIGMAGDSILYTPFTLDWDDTRSLQDGNNQFLYFKFANNAALQIKGQFNKYPNSIKIKQKIQ
jgi:subtilisin family serine protease